MVLLQSHFRDFLGKITRVAIINHSFEIGKELVAWIYALCQMLACIGIGHGL